MEQQLLVGLGLLIMEALLLHSKHTTLSRTPLDERKARRGDLYLTTHNTHKRQTSMPWGDSNPQSQQAKGPQTHVLYRTEAECTAFILETASSVLCAKWG
jgi:hypothetical protein